MTEFWAYAGFVALVIALLALDLGVLHKKAHVIGTGEALKWTAFFVTCALVFSGLVYFLYDRHVFGLGAGVTAGEGVTAREPVGGLRAAALFLTGYLVEYSLSIDNIFVIALIFAHFRIPAENQHRVLFWGILGALLMRGVMIAAGATLIARFEFIIYIFGAILLFAAWKMLRSDENDKPDLEKTMTVRLARRVLPLTTEFHGNAFFTEVGGRLAATPLFLALLIVEVTDLVFAVDSIPAIFSLDKDIMKAEPFLVFTSNVFAILGLRSLFFALAGLLRLFRYLKYSVAMILFFVAAKMLLEHWIGKVSPLLTLSFIGLCLVVGILASVWIKPKPAPLPTADSPD